MTDVLCHVSQLFVYHMHSSLSHLFAADAVAVAFFVQSIVFAFTKRRVRTCTTKSLQYISFNHQSNVQQHYSSRNGNLLKVHQICISVNNKISQDNHLVLFLCAVNLFSHCVMKKLVLIKKWKTKIKNTCSVQTSQTEDSQVKSRCIMYKRNINMSEHYISIIFSKSAYTTAN